MSNFWSYSEGKNPSGQAGKIEKAGAPAPALSPHLVATTTHCWHNSRTPGEVA